MPMNQIAGMRINILLLFGELTAFLNVQPELPQCQQTIYYGETLNIKVNMTRQEICGSDIG